MEQLDCPLLDHCRIEYMMIIMLDGEDLSGPVLRNARGERKVTRLTILFIHG